MSACPLGLAFSLERLSGAVKSTSCTVSIKRPYLCARAIDRQTDRQLRKSDLLAEVEREQSGNKLPLAKWQEANLLSAKTATRDLHRVQANRMAQFATFASSFLLALFALLDFWQTQKKYPLPPLLPPQRARVSFKAIQHIGELPFASV